MLRNELLAGLPEEVLARLYPNLAPVALHAGEILFESGAGQTDVYFPVTAVLTLSSLGPDGGLIRISQIDDHGVVGIPHFLIGKVAPCRGVVHTAGLAYRLPSQCLAQEFNRGGPALRMFLRYANALMIQMERSAACHTIASLEQQDCASCGYAQGCPLP
jgi:hypothetical protein